LRTHDLGSGPYELTQAKIGSMYELKAFSGYWGPKPYFTTVNLPVISSSATQQLEFDKGALAAVMHDLPESAVRAYLKQSSVRSYSLPTLNSDYLYVNPAVGFLTTAAHRTALLEAVNVKSIYTEGFTGRATIASPAYPAHMMKPGFAAQALPYRPAALTALVKTLPSGQRTFTVGYDSSSPDNQLVANLLSAELTPLGLNVTVQSYPTAQIYGWAPPAPTAKGAPDVVLDGGWPDAAPPYMWAHISFDPNGGLNYLHCSSPAITNLLGPGLTTGSPQIFSKIGVLSVATGCWGQPGEPERLHGGPALAQGRRRGSRRPLPQLPQPVRAVRRLGGRKGGTHGLWGTQDRAAHAGLGGPAQVGVGGGRVRSGAVAGAGARGAPGVRRRLAAA